MNCFVLFVSIPSQSSAIENIDGIVYFMFSYFGFPQSPVISTFTDMLW